jgi:hypothetical protein
MQSTLVNRLSWTEGSAGGGELLWCGTLLGDSRKSLAVMGRGGAGLTWRISGWG